MLGENAGLLADFDSKSVLPTVLLPNEPSLEQHFDSIVDGIYCKNHSPRQLHLLNSPPLNRPKRSESWLMTWMARIAPTPSDSSD